LPSQSRAGRASIYDQRARALLSSRLREQGFEVEVAPDAVSGAELILANPPHAVVTDLWMPGISGVQLCRLLRAEPLTSNVPIILLTATEDRRSRFWARCAGASAYVTKTEVDSLVAILKETDRGTIPPSTATPAPVTVARGTVQERLSELLDAALFDSTIAGEVRALAQSDGDLDRVFTDLSKLASDVAGYRWLALKTTFDPKLLVHTHPSLRDAAEDEACLALGMKPSVPEERRKQINSNVVMIEDERASPGEPSAAPLVFPVRFGQSVLGTIALGPGRRGASHEDKRLMTLLASELGGPLRMVSLVGDARRLAATDALTGLMNRRAFLEAMERESSRAQRHLYPVSLLLLDVDHFKKVNDTFGHDGGDAVLQGVAKVLARMARKSDFVSRWGGEEFVIALAQTAEAGARIAAERVRRAIAEARILLPSGEAVPVTASIGLASNQTPEFQIEEMLTRADKAMYAAKHRGRNRVETG
jgi:two-component system cell cycle response regulator